MSKNTDAHLHFRLVKTAEHLLLNLRNYNFFRKNDSGQSIMFFAKSRFLTWLIAIPYVVSSELVFLRCARYFAAFGGQIVGILIISEEKEKLYVNNLAVAPEYRRKGIATVMIAFCYEIAVHLHKNWLELSVLRANRSARSLYKRTGFELEEQRRWSLVLRKKIL